VSYRAPLLSSPPPPPGPSPLLVAFVVVALAAYVALGVARLVAG
jgi:hypothetical protein